MSLYSLLYSLRFKDGHTVFVKVGNAAGTYNYTQMGMADERNGNPTKQWQLLESLPPHTASSAGTTPMRRVKTRNAGKPMLKTFVDSFALKETPSAGKKTARLGRLASPYSTTKGCCQYFSVNLIKGFILKGFQDLLLCRQQRLFAA